MANESVNGIELGSLLESELPVKHAQLLITGLAADSREVCPGDLYFAVPGIHVDGRDFIGGAFSSGAIAVLAEAKDLDISRLEACAAAQRELVIPVKNLAEKIGQIANRFYGSPSQLIDVLAVTGTNGKSTVTQMLAQVLSHDNVKTGVIGTLGYGCVEALISTTHTTPSALEIHKILAQLNEQDFKVVALEASSHGLEQNRLAGVSLRGALFTNLTQDHLDYHGTFEDYYQAKKKLFLADGLEFAVVNFDDDFGQRLYREVKSSISKVWRYSLENEGAEVYARNISYSPKGIFAEIVTPSERAELSLPLIGAFNLQNALACVAALQCQGYSLTEIVEGLASVKAVSGRMEVITEQAAPVVVVDYAHTPDALKSAIEALRVHCDGKLWCVFGCGGDRDREKRPLMGEFASQLADRVVITSDNPRSENAEDIQREIVRGVLDINKIQEIADRSDAINFAVKSATNNDVILIAGKGHEDYQEIGGTRLPFSDAKCARLALRQYQNMKSNDANGGQDDR